MSVDIDLVVEKSADGKWIRERIPARVLGNDVYELAHSPMFARDLAADDRIKLGSDGQYTLVERGKNVSVQVFGEWGEVDALAQHVASMGGRLCGKDPNIRVFTIPLSTGLHIIESRIEEVLADWPQLSWMFGNVHTVELVAGEDESGSDVVEAVQVLRLPDGSFEVAASPMLVAGLAAGDRFLSAGDASFTLTEDGGSTAVQIFGPWDLAFLEPKVIALGGRVDGRAGDEAAVLTFPSGADIGEVKQLFAELAAEDDARTWRLSKVSLQLPQPTEP